MEGIPTFVVTREGFPDVLKNSFASLGMPYDAPMYVWPNEMFLADSDLSPLREDIDKIVEGLTKWEPEIKETGIYPAAMLTYEGKDYEEAVTNLNAGFYKDLMTDGFPIVPPTRERVEWMLRGTDLPRDTVVGIIPNRGGIATVEVIAINAVMAGCRPEYMPVILAAVEALLDPEFGWSGMQATTNPATPLLIINGPIRHELDINYKEGIFGPGFQANATIGRAIRLIATNVGGAFPGITTMSTHGQPGRYTAVIGENEERLPEGWDPLNVEQGFPAGSNTVTVFPMQDITKAGYGGLPAMAGAMRKNTQGPYCSSDAQVLCIFSPDDAAWVVQGIHIEREVMTIDVPPHTTKAEMQQYLFEHSRLPFEEALGGYNIESKLNRDKVKPGGSDECFLEYVEGAVPVVQSPDSIRIIVAGGAGLHSVYVSPYGDSQMVTKEIVLPKNWETLLKEAEPYVRTPFSD